MGREKALLEFEGEPLIHRLARRLGDVADPVLVAPGVPGRLGHLAWPEVADAVPGSGPLGGLVAALEAAPHDLLAAVAVDMPYASPALFAALAAEWSGEDAVVPRTTAGVEPLHGVYARRALPGLRAALSGGRLALREALDSLVVRVVPEAGWRRIEPTGRFAWNLNRPEDLAEPRPG